MKPNSEISEIYLSMACNPTGDFVPQALICLQSLHLTHITKRAWYMHKHGNYELLLNVFHATLQCMTLFSSDWEVHCISPFSCALLLVVSLRGRPQRNGIFSTPCNIDLFCLIFNCLYSHGSKIIKHSELWHWPWDVSYYRICQAGSISCL